MKKIFLTTILFALSAMLCAAQSPAPTVPPANDAQMHFNPGSTLPVELSKSIDAKKAHTGDPVLGKIPHDLSSNGKVIVPQDSKVMGHIAETKASSHDDKNSMVGIVFDKLALKGGSEVPLSADIQAVGAPMSSGSPMTENAPPPQDNPTGANQNSQMGTPRNVATPGSPQDTGLPSTPGNPPLTSTAQGVVGLNGLSLAQGSMQDSVISSQDKNVKLESGTQILLRTK